MSAREPRKPRLSPSPSALALLIVFTSIAVLGALYLFTIGMTAPVPAQSGANQRAFVPATATSEAEIEAEPNYDLTPTRVLDVPTAASLPPGVERPTELPPPTAIPYAPGPTASLEELMPIEEWKEYVNEQQGFSFKYPPNWYLNTTSTGQTTQIFSYDFNDPSLTGYKGPPLDVTRIDIMVNRVDQQPIDQFRGTETLREWVSRTGRLGEDDKLIQEAEFTADGLPALRQLVDFEYGGLIDGVYIKRSGDVILIGQHYREEWIVPNQVFDLLIQSFKIRK